MSERDPQFDNEAIHGWFGLTYAAYLVIPRSVLQSLPGPLQRQLVDALDAIEAHISPADAPVDLDTHYTVHLRDYRNRFVGDPLRDYDRGRRRVTADDLRLMCEETRGTRRNQP